MRKRHFSKQVGLILSEETHSRLIEQTDKDEVSVSEWIREAIQKRLLNESDSPRTPNGSNDHSFLSERRGK
jgi:predicted DNA-binding protein